MVPPGPSLEKNNFICQVDLDFGYDLFDEHESGISLSSEATKCLFEATQTLKDLPTCTVLLEGHCPGSPAENDDIRQSVGEEAADLCKSQLQLGGVQNEIVCTGLGSLHGLGMCVRILAMPAAAPPDFPKSAEERGSVAHSMSTKTLAERLRGDGDRGSREDLQETSGLSHQWSGLLKGAGQPAEATSSAEGVFGTMDGDIPDAKSLSVDQQVVMLETLVLKMFPKGITFDANRAEIQESARPAIQRLASILRTFPDIGVQCAGHADGQPAENNLIKRSISQNRARSIETLMRAEGVTNGVACAGFGSALGRGNTVRLHVLPPGEAEAEDAQWRIFFHNTDGLSTEQERASLDQLLKEAVEGGGLTFEPNHANIQQQSLATARRLAHVLKAFPNWAIRCEGHAKGQPAEDNAAKQQLSAARAQALRSAVHQYGAANNIVCAGHGCSKGLGMCVKMCGADPERDIDIPSLDGLSQAERAQLLDKLLAQALEAGIDFLPNRYDIPTPARGLIRAVARVMKAFPGEIVRCESHAKGRPTDNNEAKRRLSQTRAEALRGAVRLEGAENSIICVGMGSTEGLGMQVKMFSVDREALKGPEIDIPDTSNLSPAEQEALVNSLLAKALENNIDFEPNVYVLPASAAGSVQSLATVLNAFPSMPILCEGHTKGQPSDNNTVRVKLSHLRAEALKAALREVGVENVMDCHGHGSEQGLGMCVKMCVADPDVVHKLKVDIPSAEGLSTEQQQEALNTTVAQVLEKRKISFEPNSADIQSLCFDTISQIADILRAFPSFKLQCEGHAKGRPADNNTAKMRLSGMRAESVSVALKEKGVVNEFQCAGHGCAQGLGICVRIFVA